MHYRGERLYRSWKNLRIAKNPSHRRGLVTCYTKKCHHDYLQLVWLYQQSCYPLRQVLCLCSPCQTPKREKVFINVFISGYAGSLNLTCGYASNVHKNCVFGRSVCKGAGASPCKGQNAQVSSLKSYLWSFLEHSRRLFDVYWAPPDGSCTPTKEELIPSIRELSHPKRGLSHWWWTWLTSSWAL